MQQSAWRIIKSWPKKQNIVEDIIHSFIHSFIPLFHFAINFDNKWLIALTLNLALHPSSFPPLKSKKKFLSFFADFWIGMYLQNKITGNKIIERVLISLSNFLFGIFSQNVRHKNKKSQKAAIVAFHKIGDSIFIIPAIKAIKSRFNDLTIFCYQDNKDIYEEYFNDLRIIIISKQEILFNRFAKYSARKKISKTNPDIIFDLTGTILSASFIFRTKAVKAGLTQPYFTKLYSSYILKQNCHLVELYLRAVNTVLNEQSNSFAKIFSVLQHNKGEILIHPFAGWKAKEWNFYKYLELAAKLKNDYNCSLIFEKDTVPHDIKVQIKTDGINIIETNNLKELIQQIKNCFLLIGNDSGPIYIANMLGKPTFSIYGPTNPDFSLPFGEHHSFIQKKLKCSPKENEQYCFTDAGRNGCPAFECMNLLSVDEVYNKLITFINRNFVEAV